MKQTFVAIVFVSLYIASIFQGFSPVARLVCVAAIVLVVARLTFWLVHPTTGNEDD